MIYFPEFQTHLFYFTKYGVYFGISRFKLLAHYFHQYFWYEPFYPLSNRAEYRFSLILDFT